MTRKSGKKLKHFKVVKDEKFDRDWELLKSRTRKLTEEERIRKLLSEWKYEQATYRERENLRTKIILDMLVRELEEQKEHHKAGLIKEIRPLLIVPTVEENCENLIDVIYQSGIVELAVEQAKKFKGLD